MNTVRFNKNGVAFYGNAGSISELQYGTWVKENSIPEAVLSYRRHQTSLAGRAMHHGGARYVLFSENTKDAFLNMESNKKRIDEWLDR